MIARLKERNLFKREKRALLIHKGEAVKDAKETASESGEKVIDDVLGS